MAVRCFRSRPSALNEAMVEKISARCEAKGLRMTGQRRTVTQVLENSDDHPDVEELYSRALKIDPQISIATVYRTVKLLEELGILERLEFKDGKSRFEDAEREHHDHLIDLHSGEVIEFRGRRDRTSAEKDRKPTRICLARPSNGAIRRSYFGEMNR